MSEDKTSKPESSPTVDFSTDEIKKSIRSGIKSGVGLTNEVLASMETSSNTISTSLVSHVRSVGTVVETTLDHAKSAYSKRYQYGPGIVAGAGACLGGLVALRRGKVPGALAGGVGSLTAYTAIYKPETFQLEKKNE